MQNRLWKCLGLVAFLLMTGCGDSADVADASGEHAEALREGKRASEAPSANSTTAQTSPTQAPQTPQDIPSTGTVPTNCIRLEGGMLGEVGLSLTFGDRKITFGSWDSKDDKSEGEYIAFSFAANAPVAYAVKAGGETFYGTATHWVHPKGTHGSEAHAISNITFCPGKTNVGGDGEAPPPPGR